MEDSQKPNMSSPADDERRAKYPQLRRPFPWREPVPRWEQVDQAALSMAIEASQNDRWPILVSGLQGRGKTFFAALLYASWNAKSAEFWFGTELFRAFRTCVTHGKGKWNGISEERLWTRLSASRALVVIDEIGAKRASDFERDILREILDRRMSLPTVITTNCDDPELVDAFDARIASRLLAGTVIELDGVDRRRGEVRDWLN